jgi:hypothetical protein
MMQSIFAMFAFAAVAINAQSVGKSVGAAVTLPSPIITQPVVSSLPMVSSVSAISSTLPIANKAPQQSLAFTSVKAAQVNAPQTLPVIELNPIMQTYSVPSSIVTQENIKQPITQPVLQPYLQRYVQQAQPIVQPIVNRVVQPVIHRELHPYLTSRTEQGPAAFTLTQPTQYTMQYNQPIVGADYPTRAMVGAAKSAPAPAPLLATTTTIAAPLAVSQPASLAFTNLNLPAAQKSLN